MAQIKRSFQDFKDNVGELQTTQVWKIEVEDTNGIAGMKKLEFRTSEIEGCPPAPEVQIIDVPIGGFNLKFFGKIEKHGTVGFDFFEDITGIGGALYRAVMRSYMKSGAEGIGSTKNIFSESEKLSSKARYNVTVTLGDTTGASTKTWKFFNALCKPTQEATLNQEAAEYKYKFEFDYEMYLEANGDGKDSW
jgi:hypothetical protein